MIVVLMLVCGVLGSWKHIMKPFGFQNTSTPLKAAVMGAQAACAYTGWQRGRIGDVQDIQHGRRHAGGH